MKKGILGLLAVVIAVMLTGCGASQKLVCTKSYTESGLKMHEEVITDFSGRKVTKMEIKVDAVMEDYLLSYSDQIKAALDTQYKKYSDNGATTKVEIKDSTIHVEVAMDLKKMSSKQKKNLNVDNMNGSYSANKKDFENKGYTCK